MTDLVQVVSVVFSALLLGLVLELVRRRKLTEEYSLIWIVCAIALFTLSVWRDVLHVAARTLGVFYPPALLLLALTGFVFVVSLYFSVVVSRQRQEIERLVEEIALLDAEVRQLRESGGPVPPADVVPRAAGHGAQPAEFRRFAGEQHVRRVESND
jgi:hypothetical protein